MMNATRKRRLLFLLFVLCMLGIATCFVMYALRQNINLFYSPEQIAQGEAPVRRLIRVGGMVVPGSIHHGRHSLVVQFDITDFKNTIHVSYTGVLPTLFREGKGVVAQGKFNGTDKQFLAKEILAKHDENYMPPEITLHRPA